VLGVDPSSKTPTPAGPDSSGETLGSLGRYELLAKLATGGMGEIFLARLRGEGGFEKLIVIKRLLPELVSAEHFVSMFLDEARIAAKLSHPNVCEVYELGHEDAQYFIAMKYLEGVPFARIMERQPGREIDDDATHLRLVASLLQQACEGLQHAHDLRDNDGHPLNLVHRDVSPSNLFVTVDGVLNVLDFGIAKARGATSTTEKGSIKGKYSYMSPEQVRGEEVDRRSDVFSLGIVAHEAATGRRLFKRESDYLVAKAIIEESVPRADEVRSSVPPAMADAIARALSRAAADRYASAREFGNALGSGVADLGGPLSASEAGELVHGRFAADISMQRAQYERASAIAQHAIAFPDAAGAEPSTGPTRTLTPATVKASPGPHPIPDPDPVIPARGKLVVLVVGAVLLAAVVLALLVDKDEPDSAVRRAARPAGATTVAPEAGAHTAPTPPVVVAPTVVDAGPVEKPPPALAPPPDARVASKPPRPRKHSNGKEPAKKPGFLSLDSKPYARIYIDGKPAGVTPLIRHQLSPGKHSVRAVIESGKERRFDVIIEPGREAPARTLSW